jgi:class 3 adenylate cyclase
MLRVCATLPSLLVLAGCGTILHAGFNTETGSYVSQIFNARSYGAAAQNWASVQDRRGLMYFANTEGLLEFDGVGWRLMPLPGRAPTARSVAIDDRGSVFVGGVGEFGMLRADASGTMKFISLSSRLPEADRQFADIWRVLVTSDGIYFSSYTRLFRLNSDGSIKTWHPATKFGRAFTALGALYVKTPEAGLMKLSGEGFAAIPGGAVFAADDVTAAIPASDSAVIATAQHLYRLTTARVEQLNTSADAFFAKNHIYSMLALPDGETMVGTRRGGLALVDLSHEAAIDRIVTRENGLTDDFVTSLYADRQGGIWVTGNNGIARLNPGLTILGRDQNLQGETVTMARHSGALFAGTRSGLFRLKASQGVPPLFSRVDGINDSVLALLSFNEKLLAGTAHGLFEVSRGQARRILDTSGSIWDVASSAQDSHIIYVAGSQGVFVLREAGDSWQKASQVAPPGQEFRSVVEDEDGAVWATTRGGIWRIDFHQQPARIEKFGAEQNVPANWINARRLNGHVVFATEKGLRRYSKSDHRIAPDVSLGPEFAKGSKDVFNLFQDQSGNVWVTGAAYHGLLMKQANGYKWQPMPLLRSGVQEIYWMSIDDDGVCWVTDEEGRLFRWDRALNGNPDADFHVFTRRVQGAANTLYGGAGKLDLLSLPYAENALHFEFAAPFYEDPSSVEYRFQLEGNDRAWSRWSHQPQSDYTHLPEGSYRFKVQARTPHGATSEDATVAFGVLPPWYSTWWAYTIYLICSGVVLWSAVKLRTRKLVQEKRQLEAIVEERTVEIREQRDEIQVQQGKSQALLLNILPATVADELKSTGSVQPVAFDDVTVCFTDFVGFTLSSEQLPPRKLVDSLNEYFTAFDEIIARYGLEKLKTIGDSYMFASGLPQQRRSHAVDAVLAALEMVQVVKNLSRKPDGAAWGIRVGLHSGPVVAGVVGTSKFAFDIWGNTVNFAARMESSGVPGHVNMSERTCDLTRGLIHTRARGNVKIKEGRELPMYLALGPAMTNEEAFAERYEYEFGEKPGSVPRSYFGAAATPEQTSGAVALRTSA